MAVTVCGRCGAQNDGASVFCPGCGAVQTPTTQAPPEQFQQPQYGPYGQPAAGGYGAPTWGTPPVAQPGGWTSQAGTTGGWEHPGPYATGPVGPVGPPPERPKDPKLLLLVLGVVGVVVVAGVIAFLLLSRHGSTPPAAASATTSSAAPTTPSAASSTATASPSGGVRSLVGAPEGAPSGGSQLGLAAVGADCSYPPSVDGNGQPVTYEAQKAVDPDPATAWRCPGAGGHSIQLHGAGTVRDLGLIPGYAKVDPATGVNRFTDNHTVTQVLWRLQHGSTTVQIVQDIPNPTPQMAWIHLPEDVDVDSITLTVTGTGNPGARQDSTPISSIAAWGTG